MTDPVSESPDLAQRIRYEAIPGFFVQSEPSPPSDPHPPAFGLKARTSPTYWKDFKAHIERLQSSAPRSTRYVVCWVARHGQAFHNVAMNKYGGSEWNDKYSKDFGDGEITWGPDAKLTPLGEKQAEEVHALWKTELDRLDDPIPIPTKLFSSPLSRALATLDLTFGGILPKDIGTGEIVTKPLVMENLREILVRYTSEKRSTKAEIQKAYPNFTIEDGFTEDDEIWNETISESNPIFIARMKATLDTIFGEILESSDTFISITAHAGVASAILRIIGHRSYSFPTGGVVPVVIKVTQAHSSSES